MVLTSPPQTRKQILRPTKYKISDAKSFLLMSYDISICKGQQFTCFNGNRHPWMLWNVFFFYIYLQFGYIMSLKNILNITFWSIPPNQHTFPVIWFTLKFHDLSISCISKAYMVITAKVLGNTTNHVQIHVVPWTWICENEKKKRFRIHVLMPSLRHVNWFIWPPTSSVQQFKYAYKQNSLT